MAECFENPSWDPEPVGDWIVRNWHPVAAVDAEHRSKVGIFAEGVVIRLAVNTMPKLDVLVWVRHDGSLGSISVFSADDAAAMSVRSMRTTGACFGEAERVAKEYLSRLQMPEDLEVERTRLESIAYYEGLRSNVDPASPVGLQLQTYIQQLRIGGGSGLSTFRTLHDSPRKRGRPPYSEPEILEVIKTYADECTRGVHGAVSRTAHKLDCAVSKVSACKKRAQEADLLFPTVRGKGGGVLTARARALLASR